MRSNRPQSFNEWAECYDDGVRASSEFPFLGYDSVLRQAFQLADPTPRSRVLDLGIGTGNLARYFVDFGCDVTGIDFSPKMLAAARLKLPGVHLVEADLSGEWPLSVEVRFDRVVSGYAFHHFELARKIDILLRTVRYRLMPGGRVVIADVSFSFPSLFGQAQRRWEKLWDPSEYYWEAEATAAACRESGLTMDYLQVSECGGVFVFEPQ